MNTPYTIELDSTYDDLIKRAALKAGYDDTALYLADLLLGHLNHEVDMLFEATTSREDKLASLKSAISAEVEALQLQPNLDQ